MSATNATCEGACGEGAPNEEALGFFAKMPVEILDGVLRYLNPTECGVFAATCHRMRDLYRGLKKQLEAEQPYRAQRFLPYTLWTMFDACERGPLDLLHRIVRYEMSGTPSPQLISALASYAEDMGTERAAKLFSFVVEYPATRRIFVSCDSNGTRLSNSSATVTDEAVIEGARLIAKWAPNAAAALACSALEDMSEAGSDEAGLLAWMFADAFVKAACAAGDHTLVRRAIADMVHCSRGSSCGCNGDEWLSVARDVATVDAVLDAACPPAFKRDRDDEAQVLNGVAEIAARLPAEGARRVYAWMKKVPGVAFLRAAIKNGRADLASGWLGLQQRGRAALDAPERVELVAMAAACPKGSADAHTTGAKEAVAAADDDRDDATADLSVLEWAHGALCPHCLDGITTQAPPIVMAAIAGRLKAVQWLADHCVRLNTTVRVDATVRVEVAELVLRWGAKRPKANVTMWLLGRHPKVETSSALAAAVCAGAIESARVLLARDPYPKELLTRCMWECLVAEEGRALAMVRYLHEELSGTISGAVVQRAVELDRPSVVAYAARKGALVVRGDPSFVSRLFSTAVGLLRVRVIRVLARDYAHLITAPVSLKFAMDALCMVTDDDDDDGSFEPDAEAFFLFTWMFRNRPTLVAQPVRGIGGGKPARGETQAATLALVYLHHGCMEARRHVAEHFSKEELAWVRRGMEMQGLMAKIIAYRGGERVAPLLIAPV